jgi:hypothetical protein
VPPSGRFLRRVACGMDRRMEALLATLMNSAGTLSTRADAALELTALVRATMRDDGGGGGDPAANRVVDTVRLGLIDMCAELYIEIPVTVCRAVIHGDFPAAARPAGVVVAKPRPWGQQQQQQQRPQQQQQQHDSGGSTAVVADRVVRWIAAGWSATGAPFDAFGLREHSLAQHQIFDAIYGAVPKILKAIGGVRSERNYDQAAACARAAELGTALSTRLQSIYVAAAPYPPELHGLHIAGHVGAFFGDPVVTTSYVAALVEGGALEATAQCLRGLPLDSVECYFAGVGMMFNYRPEHSARWRSSAVLEAVVAFVDRSRGCDHVHVGANRSVAQTIANIAGSGPEGRALLLGTPGLEDALQYLVEHGGDPIGIAENRTLVSPCAMSGLALALLYGREETGTLVLSAKTVHLILHTFNTYLSWGAMYCLQLAQGLAECSVSDAHKQHFLSMPASVDILRAGLFLSRLSDEAGSGEPSAEAQVRACCCTALAQLAASEQTLPLLLGHSVLLDLTKLVASLPAESGLGTVMQGDAANDAKAALLAVNLHEAKQSHGLRGAMVQAEHVAAGAREGGADSGPKHIMLSYAWAVQRTIKRIRDALDRRGYRVWLDVEKMQGSTLDAMSDAVDGAAVPSLPHNNYCQRHPAGCDEIPALIEILLHSGGDMSCDLMLLNWIQ